MGLRVVFLSILVLLVACGAEEATFAGELTAPVVYGDDDRLEVYAHPSSALRAIAEDSVVALIPTSRLNRESDGTYSLFTFSLKDERGLCDDERFVNQPVAASCSGVLIADDLVLTAGHCIGPQRPCTSFSFVFDYYLDAPDRLAPIDDEDVYTCNRVVVETSPSIGTIIPTPDFAIIELDRPVEGGHVPVAVRGVSPLQVRDPLAMIGFGSGLPAKIDAGAQVADPRAEELDYFVANLDAFEGHSGSATLDADHRLAGILIGGRVPDYVIELGEGCSRVNVFDDSEAGEIVQSVAPVIAALCEVDPSREELCGPDSCDGEPCGSPTPPDLGGGGGAGVIPEDPKGCSATGRTDGDAPAPLALLALGWLAFRFRPRAA